jgi:hypothetical protein
VTSSPAFAAARSFAERGCASSESIESQPGIRQQRELGDRLNQLEHDNAVLRAGSSRRPLAPRRCSIACGSSGSRHRGRAVSRQEDVDQVEILGESYADSQRSRAGAHAAVAEHLDTSIRQILASGA